MNKSLFNLQIFVLKSAHSYKQISQQTKKKQNYKLAGLL